MPVERLAGVGQREASRGATEETHAEALLEPREAAAEMVGRGAQKLGGRTRQRLGLDDAREREKLGGFDGFPHTGVKKYQLMLIVA